MRLVDKIKMISQRSGWTATQIARRAEIEVRTFLDILARPKKSEKPVEMKLSMGLKLAKSLKIPLDWLADDELDFADLFAALKKKPDWWQDDGATVRAAQEARRQAKNDALDFDIQSQQLDADAAVVDAIDAAPTIRAKRRKNRGHPVRSKNA